MRLTRRDALAALAAAGAASAAGCTAPTARDDGPLAGTAVETMVAASAVVYPSAVEGRRPFVRTYLDGRTADAPDRRRAIETTTADLDAVAERWHGEPFDALPVSTRESTLRSVGADTADPDPEGSLAGRVRFHVVNELLFGLFSSPTGGELVGVENPVGYPGGTTSYRQGP
jgi:hypothetical protein